MTLTNFPYGLSSFGVPVLPSGWMQPFGRVWFVNGGSGAGGTGGTGTEPDSPFLTMDAAFDQVGSGDTIFFKGNIKEQLTTPAGVFDVTIVGCGNSPRHADAHTGNNGYSGATWKAPDSPTASTPLLKVQQQGWRFANFLFGAAPAATPAVDLFRDGGAGDAERDASHATFYGMRFDAGPIGIRANGGPAFIGVFNSLFRGQTTTAIANTVGAGIGTNLCWQIQGNRFASNVNHIVAPLSQAVIWGNSIGVFTTMGIDLNGGAGDNQVVGNYLNGTYSIVGGYRRAAASDNWNGNFAAVTGGVTDADPA